MPPLDPLCIVLPFEFVFGGDDDSAGTGTGGGAAAETLNL
jgi:hypothetical protein